MHRSLGCVIPAVALAAASLVLPVVAALHEVDDSSLTPAERAAGWVVLFDGSSTDAFRGYRSDSFPERGWSIDGDALRVHAGGGGGDLVTRETYENFDLAFEWKVAPGANSGVMYRVTEDEGATWQTGPEFQILDDAGTDTRPGDPHAAGALYALYPASEAKTTKPAGEWNTGRIVMRDGVVSHFLNGSKVLEADLNSEDWRARVQASKFRDYEGFGTNDEGRIAFQDHGNDVWYRNIRIRDLDRPLPNEVRLFRGLRRNASVVSADGEGEAFRVEDGELIVNGSPVGYVRTPEPYENFVLLLEWRWDPEGAPRGGNGGVLLRGREPDRVWPKSLEVQLHAGSAGDLIAIDGFGMEGDPERTDGRFVRIPASAEKPIGEWNRMEVVLDGDRVRVFVNDEKVNEGWNVERGAGFVGLQSEGAPMRVRRVRLAPIGEVATPRPDAGGTSRPSMGVPIGSDGE